MISFDPRDWFSSNETEWATGHSPDDVRIEKKKAVHKQRVDESVKRRRNERKQDDGIDRKTTLSPEIQRKLKEKQGVPKPYSPDYLKGLANNWVVEAYIDTLAQDVATAPWTIKPRDEEADIDPERLAEVEREIKELHPTQSFRDLREQLVRTMLQLGDGAWIKHYDVGGHVAEAVPVDTSRLYKVVDEHGFTQKYLQATTSRQQIQPLDTDEVVWVEWAHRPDHIYGEGPVEKGQEVIEVLEELGQKEINDLAEGMPPGIASVNIPDSPQMAEDAKDKVQQNWELRQGERHRAVVSHGDWDFTPLQSGYQELQFLERNQTWIQSLGAVFKVNAPYAGFDFQEGNRAQNEAQTQAYKQRGFNVVLRQIQEALNRQLIWPDFSEELRFEFEDHQSIGEKKEHADYQKRLADAAEQWDNLGRTVTYRDGKIEIEDGEVDAPEDDGGGGLFASVDKDNVGKAVTLSARMDTSTLADTDDGMEQWRSFLRDIERLDGIVEATDSNLIYPNDDNQVIPPSNQLKVHGVSAPVIDGLLAEREALGYDVQDHETDRKNKSEGLTKDEVAKLDECLLEAHRTQIQPKNLEDIEKRVWSGDESVPEYVREKIADVIDRGAIFDGIKSIPADTLDTLQDTFKDVLTDEDGWSLDGLVDTLSDQFPGVDDSDLETVARTESASVLNQAREEGYEDLPSSDTNPKFYWQGPSDERMTDLCEELKAETNPQDGGTPVEMPALKRMHENLANEHFPELEYREFVGHPNERHTFVRAPPQGVDVELSVSKELPDAVFDDISESRFIPPQGAAEEAQQALDWIDEHGRDEASGGTEEGLARARQIVEHVENDEPLIEENNDGTPFVVEIANFFARHEGDEDIDEENEGEPWQDNGYFSHLLWGGDPGKQWAQSLKDRLEEEGHL